MIPFIAGNKKFEVPSNWNELTLHQAIELTKIKDSEDIAMFLSVITGLPYDDAKRISLGDLVFLLGPVLEFLKDDLDNEQLMNQPLPGKIVIDDIIIERFNSPGQMVWAQHLSFQTVTANNKISDIEKLPDIIAICIQNPDEYSEIKSEELKPKILKMCINDSFALAGYFLKSITYFYQRNKLNIDENYTSEQIRAGIKEFSKFGAFNSIDTLAGGDITKWGKVVMLPMSDVMLKLMMNQQQYRYQKKYNEIMSKKK